MTIVGSNFNRIEANNVVYFGGIRATVVNVTGNGQQLTATAPAGATYDLISITTGGLTAYSRVPFRLVSSSTFIPSFASKKSVGPGRNVGSADFDADGRSDLITSVVDTNRLDYLGWYRNTTVADSMTFTPVGRSPLGTARGPFSVGYGDLDGDGLLDAAMVSNDNNYVSIFRNTSTGSAVQFSRVIEIPIPGAAAEVVIRDLNADGKPEVVLPPFDSSLVLILPNTSSGVGSITFGMAVRLTAGGKVRSVAVSDIDGDNLADVVTTEPELGRVAIYRKNGSGNLNFFARQTFSMGSNADKVRLGDLDGDGRPDLAVANAGSPATVTVRLNTSSSGTIAFGSSASFAAGGSFAIGLAIGELNGDGKPDVAVANYNVDSMTVLLNTSPGSGNIAFASPLAYATGRGPYNVAIADFNNDGRNDLAIGGDRGDYRFSETVVLRNAPPRGTFTANRTSLTFTTPVNTTKFDSVSVTNTGSDTLRISSASVRTTKFQVTPNGARIAPGASVTFRVSFIPLSDTTLLRDTLRFSHDGPTAQDLVLLNGKAIAPAISLNRSTLSFSAPINTSRTDSVIVTNPGTDTLKITSATVRNSAFTVTPNSAVIPAGGSRAFRLTFSPASDTTLKRDTLRLVHNAAGSPAQVFMSGRGTSAMFSANRSSLTFATVVNTSQTDSVTITNAGSDTLRISSASLANARFQVSPSSGNLPPGGSRVFRVTFSPQNDTTLQRDTLKFFHNLTGSPGIVLVSGRGTLLPSPSLTLDRTSLSFSVLVNTSGTDSVRISNTGTDTLRITSMQLRNPRFQIVPTTATIAPGGARIFRVTFSPLADTTLQRDTLRIFHNAFGSPNVVVLSGKATLSALALFSLNRSSLSFTIPINTSRTDSVVVTNGGTDTLRITSASGSNARFQVIPQAASVPPGAARQFRVSFSPQQDTSLQRDTVRFVDNASGSPHLLLLSGRGLAPAFAVNRNSLAFAIPINSSRTDSVAVSNTGTDTLKIISAFVRNAKFQVQPLTASILPGNSTIFRVTFTPQTDTLLQRDTVTFVHNALNSPHRVFLTGKGNALPAPLLSLNRISLAFNVPLNTTRTDSVMVSNAGTDTLRVFSASLANPKFQSTPSNANIPPGNARIFRITFSPQNDTTLQRDTLRLQHNAAGSPGLVSLTGRGIPPSIPFFQADSNSFSFGKVVVNANRDYAISVTNPGTATLRIDSIRSTNNAFRVVTFDTASIAALERRQFTVRFQPTSVGTKSAALKFYHNAQNRSDSLSLRGTGQLPAPLSLRIVDSTSSVGQIRLQWDPVPMQQGFLHYTIYWSTTPDPSIPRDSTIDGRSDSSYRTITDLVIGTRYFFRVTSVDSFRVESPVSNQVSIVIPVRSPETVTVSAQFDSATAKAILRGFVNPAGVSTTAWFEYDSLPLPSIAPRLTPVRLLGGGTSLVQIDDSTSVLSRGKSYSFRLVAQNSFGIRSNGNVETFFVPAVNVPPPPAPVLSDPADNASIGSSSSVQVKWARSAGAVTYHVQIGLDSSFSASTFFLLNDSTVTDSAKTLPRLAGATWYYWRVGAKNSAVPAARFSSVRRFATEPSRSVQSPTFAFPSTPRSETDYRLVGAPGSGVTVQDLVNGAGADEGVDWRVFRDNGGSDTSGHQHLESIANPSTFLSQGEGYWLIRKNSLQISKPVAMTPLARDGTQAISLHEGFNIVSNPFEVAVPWNLIAAKNPGFANTRLSSYTGYGYDSSNTMESFKGYYIFKPGTAPNVLRVPYPFFASSTQSDSPSRDWQVQVEYRSGVSVDKLNFFGISNAAAEGLDSLEHYKPPMVFRHGYLYFARPEWDSAYPLFSDDFRPTLGEGQLWDFEVSNPGKNIGTILFHGIQSIPSQYRVALINRSNTASVDLRRASEYSFTPATEKTGFRLIVGSAEFVSGEAAKFVPDRFVLMQNYPNPFNPSTVISYTVSRDASIRCDVVSVLGENVKTLVDGIQAPALYTLRWDATADDGSPVASGVYFYRLIVDGNIVGTRKLVLMR